MSISIYRTPYGVDTVGIPKSGIADYRTSKELIQDHENDAFYFRLLESHKIFLNAEQIKATRSVHGTLLTIAGAGTGKTTTMVARTGYFIMVEKIQPELLLLVTFTRKAAEEMKSRIELLDQSGQFISRKITAGTFHSIFLRILRSYGYNQKILSNEKYKHTIIKILLKEMKLQDAYQPETLLSILSGYKTKLVDLANLPEETPVEKEMKYIFLEYEMWKKKNHYIDFDDILVETYKLLNDQPTLLNTLQNRFRYIMVDEAQDMNKIQYQLIQMIARPQNNLALFGDDDQTIYSFNGAEREILLDFDKHYPNTKIVVLDTNYRSSETIVGLGNEVIRFNKARRPKQLKATKKEYSNRSPYYSRPSTTEEEAEMVIRQIIQSVNKGERKYKDFAVLYRTHANSRAIYEQLIMKNIPVASFQQGEGFYQQSVIRPVIAYLRLSIAPNDMNSIETILPTLYLSRGEIKEHLEFQQLIEPLEQPIHHLLHLPNLKSYQKNQIEERIHLIEQLKNMKTVKAIQEIRKFYEKYLDADDRKTLTLHKALIKELLDELEDSAKRFDKIEQFLSLVDQMAEKQVLMEQEKNDPNEDKVSLLSIHRAKGLEFPVIFMIGVSEGILPHESAIEADRLEDMMYEKKRISKSLESIEEERRLAYVAITRAKEELFISSPTYYRGKKVEVSRFLLEPFDGV